MVTNTGKHHDIVLASSWASAGIVLLALVFRSALLCLDVYPFNADEAIVALMARHTLHGHWPIFFYGQAYMGSLDASLVAIGFKLFGEQVWVIRFIQLLLYAGILLTSMRLSWSLSRSRFSILITGLLLAIPTVNLNLYTTVSLGGYGEALLLGNIILLISLQIRKDGSRIWLYLLWGLSAGVGLWAFGLTLIYTVPAFIFILFSPSRNDGDRRSRGWVAWVIAGFLIGITPILFWVSQNGIATLASELLGSAVAGTSGSGYLETIVEHFLNFAVFGITATFGLRPPWSTQIFLWPAAILVSLFWLAVMIQSLRALRGRSAQTPLARLLGSIVLLVLFGFLLTPFGGDPSGRYFLPITVVSAIVAGLLFSVENEWFPRWLAWALFCVVIGYHLSTNLHVALKSASGFSTQFDEVARIDHDHDEALIHFLNEHGASRGFTNYWVAYPLAFKSSEKLIFIPRLPYHLDFRYTSRDNRYVPYNAIVNQSREFAYITTNHPVLDEKIRSRFDEFGMTWKEESIGDYQIFYDLSQPVFPEDIDARFQ